MFTGFKKFRNELFKKRYQNKKRKLAVE